MTRGGFSFVEYVQLEERSPIKHEYLDGVVYAMAGGSPEHAALAARVIALLGAALEGRPCRVFTSDLRVRVIETGLRTYPDATVVCDHLERDPDDPLGHGVVNPTVIVEVLSPSTEDYDRGEKLAHYKRIATLREIVLVAHDAQRIEVWRRDGARWAHDAYGEGECARLESVGCELDVGRVYEDPLAG